MEKKSIGSFIAALRKSHGMTQQEVADRLNVSNKTVSKWERDESYPEITLIPVIAELFNVTSDEILRGERISRNEATEDRQDKKVDKQINRIINKSISSFKNVTYIAMALTLVGVICLFTISYAFYRPVLAFGIFMIFIIASILLMTIHVNNTGTLLEESDILEDKVELIKPLLVVRNKYAYINYITNVVVFIFSLPIILVRDKVILHSVIALKSYIALIPILFMISWAIYKAVNMIKERVAVNSNSISKRYSHKSMNRMNVIQGLVIIAEYILLAITKGGEAGQSSGRISVFAIFLPIGVIVLSTCINIIKGYDFYDRLIIALAGARNFLFGYIGLFFVFGIIEGALKVNLYNLSRFFICIMWLSIIITILYEICRIRYIRKIAD